VLKTLSDAEIIASSRTAPDRFGAIFDRHFALIHRYLHRRVGQILADDLAAETFAIAFRERGNYHSDREDARPWLFGIAANLLRRHRRTERRSLAAYARSGVDPVAEAGFDAVEDRVVADAAGASIAHALKRLRAEDREVLLLYAWADLTYHQIADALAIPVGTVRSRLARARRSVREHLIATGHIQAGGAHDQGDLDG